MADEQEFRGRDLRGARFTSCDLSGAVMRAVDVDGLEVDAPWLLETGEGRLVVNGVNVAPLVDRELNRRFPGRELRRAETASGLRAAWRALEDSWSAAVARARAMPEGSLDASVDGEWSFAQTLRHLVMATDTWLRWAVLDEAEPYHPIGQPHDGYATDGHDPSVFRQDQPGFDEVLAVRADRQRMVREYLAGLTDDELSRTHRNPWAPEHPETTLSCLRTILEEEWEHQRYAVRDLDALAERR